MIHPARCAVFLILSFLLAVDGVHGADPVKQTIKRTNQYFKGKTFVAKVQLHSQAKYDIRSDGSPLEDRKQARRFGGLGIGVGDVAFQPGDAGKLLAIARANDHKLKVQIGRGRGWIAAQHSAIVRVHFDRPIRAEDVEPPAIAAVLGGIITIEGLPTGGQLAGTLEEAASEPGLALETTGDAAAPAAPVTPQTTSPATPSRVPVSPTVSAARETVVALNVRAEPSRVRHGETVDLVLDFEVRAPAGAQVAVRESRTLSYAGSTLPNFPVVTESTRGAGTASTAFPQPIPEGAQPGTYTLRGEVCVGGDCISRSVTFEILR